MSLFTNMETLADRSRQSNNFSVVVCPVSERTKLKTQGIFHQKFKDCNKLDYRLSISYLICLICKWANKNYSAKVLRFPTYLGQTKQFFMEN